ncbi:MAG: glycosyltransferase family 4 protein [Planctomycetes bacterium]|nr:glycosyltransferase family 4 protein [Planctomycetota bacterium]
MRIGIDLLSESGAPGGVHTYSNRLIEALLDLASSRFEGAAADLELVLFLHDDFQWMFAEDKLERGRVQRIFTGRKKVRACRRRWLEQTLLPRLLDRHPVDLLHSVNNVLPLRVNLPRVVTVHDLSPYVLPGRFGFFKRTFLRWAVPRSILAANLVIAVSQNTRTEILRRIAGVQPEKVAVTPEGFDLRFHPRRDPEAEEKIRRRHQLPDPFLLYVGAGEPGKNLLGVSRALALLHEKFQLNIPWVLAGASGPHLDWLERQWLEMGLKGWIRTLGLVPDEELPHLYRMANVFIFPSLYEGFGLPLLEALACGTPAITSQAPSALAELAGNAALRVDPQAPEEIAFAIAKLWKNLRVRESYSGMGLARAAEFSWEATALKTLRIYQQVLGGKPSDGSMALQSRPYYSPSREIRYSG